MSQNQSTKSVAEKLIQEHFEADPNLAKVLWINPDLQSEIRLLEINEETIVTGMVQSFYFPPSDEYPYAMKLAEATPEEWEEIVQNKIPLPNGWTLENFKTYSREKVAA